MTVKKSKNLNIEPDYDSENVWGNSEANLNKLVNNQNINDPNETIYIMSLISEHNINSEKEVLEELNNHRDDGCDKHSCDLVMSNSLDDRVEMMYESQIDEWNFKKYSKETCKKYLYDLYTRKSINGNTMEDKAIDKLQNSREFIQVKKSVSDIDNKYAVDLEIKTKVSDSFCGIQVKPKSYSGYVDDVEQMLPNATFHKNNHEMNEHKNNKYNNPVFYLEYEDEEFENLEEVVNQIENLALDLAFSN